MTSAVEQQGRTRDGVPIWNGEAATFQAYEEMALQWEQGVSWHKRYLCGPRLVSELAGTARRYIVGKRPDWVSFNGGVRYLLDHLRQALGRPQISDMTDHLNRYFKNTKRKKMESMNEYVTRKTEAYARARQAFVRVAEQYDRPSWNNWDRESNWTQWPTSRASWGGWTDPGHDEDDDEYHSGVDEAPPGEEGDDPWAHFEPQQAPRSRGTRSTYEDEHWQRSSRDFIPDFLQGWYLLQDASLDGAERNMIQTAIQGDFSLQKVAHELRAQWPEDELRRRDQSSRQSGMWAEDPGGLGGWETEENYYQHEDLGGLNEEGLQIMWSAEEEAEEAYAMLEKAKRTLQEARDKQKMVKMSRQYYRTTSYRPRTWEKGGKGSGKNSKGGPSSCLRCGGNHRTGQCPDKVAPTSNAMATEAAPFVCYVEQEESYQAEEDDLILAAYGQSKSTQEAIDAGMGILDGGATRTLASVHALERLMEANEKKYGTNGVLKVDTEEKPTFGFGNSSKDTCISTAKVEISANQQPGVIKIHALDKGTGPILISVDTLRSLGAVIDFTADLVAFRALDKHKVIPLERSSSGHQLLSLTDDLYRNARHCEQAVPSLADLC